MADTVVLGNNVYQVNDREAEWLHNALGEGGPGLPNGGLPAFELEAIGGDSLGAALARVQEQLPEVLKAETAKIPGKEGKSGYSYSYADLAAVSRAIVPLLGKHGLSWITKPTLRDGKFVLEYKLLHGASGQAEEGVYPLPDRGSPQDVGSAITYARRYCLCSVTGVAPDDDDDAAQATANHGRNTMVTPPMSDYERRMGFALLRVPTAEEREQAGELLMVASFVQSLDFERCLNERGAWRQPSTDEDSATWEQLFHERVAAEIAAVRTPLAWKELRNLLKEREMDRAWKGVKFSQLLNARALEIQQEQAKLVSQLTEAATNAGDLAQVDTVWGRAEDAEKSGLITMDQYNDVAGVLEDRRQKLDRQHRAEALNG